MHRLLSAPVFALLAGMAAAAGAAGTSFQHKDWELACDNTGTCRAAGYQREGDEQAVSVLLTRAAGAGQPVAGQVAIGSYDEPARVPASVTLTVGGRAHGAIAVKKDDATGELSPAQVQALLQALQQGGDIAFVAGAQRWRLSDAGATAVLVKMDEAQGRLGTTGALARRGASGEGAVRAPLAPPVVHAAAVPGGAAPPQALAVAVLRSLRKPPADCPDLAEPAEPAKIWRLAPGKVLVSQRCWLAAYNAGYGFWIASDRAPHRPQAVTYDATEFDADASRIVAIQKGRGLGDCFASKAWVWDGTRFVPTEESTTGQCRMVAAGGPWHLPTLVTEVVPPAGKRTTEEKRK
jgi:hypothetical protein